MGAALRRAQIDPTQVRRSSGSLLATRQQISRANFKFLRRVGRSGIDEESVLWLACNLQNEGQLFYVRQISKIKVYNHKRIQAVIDEMRLLTQISSPYLIKVYFAFHDHEFLYLVTQAIDSIPFTKLLGNFPFSEDHTRYVVCALISLLEDLHARGYAFTQLSPSNLHFDRDSGQLKVQCIDSWMQLMEIPNPALIDSYFSSNAVTKLCRYSAPQILLRGKVLAESDFYSIGVIIYEMMTEETLIPSEKQASIDRGAILKEEIQVEKSKIPEDWEPESADFLIKLLIKNPALRLGRFGTFQLKNHPWLRSFDHQNQFRRLDFTNFSFGPTENLFAEESKLLEDDRSRQLIRNHYFQALFQEYQFRWEPELEQPESSLQKSEMLLNYSNINLQLSG